MFIPLGKRPRSTIAVCICSCMSIFVGNHQAVFHILHSQQHHRSDQSASLQHLGLPSFWCESRRRRSACDAGPPCDAEHFSCSSLSAIRTFWENAYSCLLPIFYLDCFLTVEF